MNLKLDAYLGIDPGKKGAMALMTEEKEICTMSFISFLDMAGTLRTWKENYNIKACALEMVGAMPGQGVVSLFNFGTNYGFWQGILAGNEIGYELIRPQKWQKPFFQKTHGEGKERAVNVVKQMFPAYLHLFQKKSDGGIGGDKDTISGRADALLLALFAKRYLV